MSAAKAIRSNQPASLHNLSDGQLADEHRGQSFAKRRAVDRLKDIEAELDRRGLTEAKGELSVTEKKPSSFPFVDLERLRADLPALCAIYAKPQEFWSSRTLTAAERGA